MAILTTSDFDTQKEKGGHSPIFLVELLGLGRFFATKDPGFSGLWLAGDGLTATATDDTDFHIFADDVQPSYTEGLHKLSNNGISNISFSLAQDDFARTGDSAVSFINTEFLNLGLEGELLENTVVRIMLGWDGLDRADYIPVFKGVGDITTAAFERLDMRLADDTQRNIVPVPAQIGNDFRPRSFDQGKAFPIVLGDVEDVPMVQLVGDADSVLGVALLTTDVDLLYFDPTTPFPLEGTVRVTDSSVNYTVTYSGVTTTTINNQVYGTLNLTSAPASNAATGATVTLESHTKKYVVSFAGQNIRRIRKDTGAAPAGDPTWTNEAIDPTGEDHRRITVVDLPNATADGEVMTATITSEARGLNLVFNGNFADNATGWTVTTGAFNQFLPASTFDQVGRIQTLAAQVLQSNVHQDITVEAGKRHRFTFTARNSTLTFMAVNIGTPSDATKYYQFADMDETSEKLFDLIFLPDEATVRITLIGDNAGSGSAQEGYFDQFDLYDVTTENPSTQIEHLIDTHMPQIDADPTSFAEAFTSWDDSQDRIAGVLQQTEEQQALLGRIAQQFRAKTFLNESGNQKMVVFDQSRIPERDLVKSDIVKGTMRVRRSSLKEIFTHYYVYYGRIPEIPTAATGALGGRQSFSGVSIATPSETSHPVVALNTLCAQAKAQFRKESTLEVFADLAPDAQTAGNLLEFLVRKGTHQRLRLEFHSFLRMVDIEVADFVTVTHPLLSTTHIYEVKEKELAPNGCTTRWVVEQVDVFKFGSFTEKWEGPRLRQKAQILAETWEPGQPGEEGPPDENNLLNGILETWDGVHGFAQSYNLSFEEWDTTDALTTALYAGASYFGSAGFQTTAPYEATELGGAIPMYPSFGNSLGIGNEVWSPNPKLTFIRGKLYSIAAAAGNFIALSVGDSEFENNSDSIQLRPTGTPGVLNEFIRVHALRKLSENAPNSNPAFAEDDDWEDIIPGCQVNMSKPFSLRIFVKLNDKSNSYPIWQGYDQRMTDADPISQLPFALYYNSSTDRFEFAVENFIPGRGSNLATNVASLTQKVQATTLGSPSTATWYQIVATFDPATNTATIKANTGATDSNVITPDYTGSIVKPGLIGGWSLTSDGTALDDDTSGVGADRVTLNGHVAHWAYWGRVLTNTEGNTLYGAGTPYRFDKIGV